LEQVSARAISQDRPRECRSVKFVLYAPAEAGLPWLVVVLRKGRIVESFGYAGRRQAERVMMQVQARAQATKAPGFETLGYSAARGRLGVTDGRRKLHQGIVSEFRQSGRRRKNPRRGFAGPVMRPWAGGRDGR